MNKQRKRPWKNKTDSVLKQIRKRQLMRSAKHLLPQKELEAMKQRRKDVRTNND